MENSSLKPADVLWPVLLCLQCKFTISQECESFYTEGLGKICLKALCTYSKLCALTLGSVHLLSHSPEDIKNSGASEKAQQLNKPVSRPDPMRSNLGTHTRQEGRTNLSFYKLFSTSACALWCTHPHSCICTQNRYMWLRNKQSLQETAH